MNIKYCFLFFSYLLLAGCGGGGSSGDSSASNLNSFEHEQNDSQIIRPDLDDRSIVNTPIEDVDLNSNLQSLSLPQNYVSNVTYGSNLNTFVRSYYDQYQGFVVFTHFLDYPNNTAIQYELGYDLTRNNFVYLDAPYSISEMGSVVNLNEYSTSGSLDGNWESDCVHYTHRNDTNILYQYDSIYDMQISGNSIKITHREDCISKQKVDSYEGEMVTKIMYDEFSKRQVIVAKDPETEYGIIRPKRYLLSKDNKTLIRFFGVNTYTVFHKTN